MTQPQHVAKPGTQRDEERQTTLGFFGEHLQDALNRKRSGGDAA